MQSGMQGVSECKMPRLLNVNLMIDRQTWPLMKKENGKRRISHINTSALPYVPDILKQLITLR